MRLAGQLHERTGAVRLIDVKKRAASIALTARPGRTIVHLYISTHRLAVHFVLHSLTFGFYHFYLFRAKHFCIFFALIFYLSYL